MKLSKRALKAINDKTIRLKLAMELKVTEQWIITLLGNNKENGPLTTAGAMRVIRQETRLSDDQILVAEKTTVS